MRNYKTRERKACEKQEFVRLARQGEQMGCFKLGEVDIRAASGEFFPSDHILIEGTAPHWVFLYKVTDTFFHQFNTEKHLALVEQEKKKVDFWITEKKKEITANMDVATLRLKNAELASYMELLKFLEELPKELKEIEQEELEEQEQEEKREKLELMREKRKRDKNLVKVKKEVWKIVKMAKRMKDDADGTDEWYNTYYIGSNFLDAAKLLAATREHNFSEAEINWIAEEIIKKDNDSDFSSTNATEAFERFFHKQPKF